MNLLQYSIGITWNNLSNVGLGIELVEAAISIVARCHCCRHHPCPVVVVAGDIETDGRNGRGSKMAAGIEMDGGGIVEMNGWCWLVMSKWMVVVAHCGSEMGQR